MRRAFVIEAVIELEPGGDPRAIGGAVTLALCGAFEHPGRCPLAPHRTAVESLDGVTRARVVAACEADRQEAVVGIVTAALGAGGIVDPDGAQQRWWLRSCRVAELLDDDERALASRLTSAA